MSSMFPGASAQTTSNDPAANATEQHQIDLNADVTADNPTADFNERIPPPTAGLYLFKWELAEKGIVPAQGKKPPHVPFLNCYLIGRLQEADTKNDGFVVNYYFNSMVAPRKGTSEAHHFLSVAGHPVPQTIKLGAFKQMLEETLAANPIAPALIEWKASYRDPNKLDNQGNPVWVEQFTRMDQFPWELDETTKKPTGIRSNIAISKLDGAEIFAQAYVVKIVTDGEYKAAKK